jgi:predicted flap endonuclease-1-like 5' DNA nuclease
MAFTMNEIALLVVALVIGLVFGLMSSGRGKYRRLWREEQAAHRQTIKDRDTRLKAAQMRIEELERQSGLIGPGTAAAVAGAARGRDDLTRIRTISDQDEIALNEAGYHRYSQIAALSDEQQATLEARLGWQPGLIARDEWREQARMLGAGKSDEHARVYDRRKTAV